MATLEARKCEPCEGEMTDAGNGIFLCPHCDDVPHPASEECEQCVNLVRYGLDETGSKEEEEG